MSKLAFENAINWQAVDDLSDSQAQIIFDMFEENLPDAPIYHGIKSVRFLWAGDHMSDPHLVYHNKEVNAYDVEWHLESDCREFYETEYDRDPTDDEIDSWITEHQACVKLYIEEADEARHSFRYRYKSFRQRTA